MDDKKQARKRSILDAAERLFAEKGYEGSSIRDVARATGVADGTIYNYFANKEALLDELVRGLIERLGSRESLRIGFDDDSSRDAGSKDLETRVMERMRSLHEDYERIAAVLPVALGRPQLRRILQAAFVAPVTASIEGELAPREAPIEARVLVAASLGFQVLMLLGDEVTRSAWEDPAGLAKVWARFIRAAVG